MVFPSFRVPLDDIDGTKLLGVQDRIPIRSHMSGDETEGADEIRIACIRGCLFPSLVQTTCATHLMRETIRNYPSVLVLAVSFLPPCSSFDIAQISEFSTQYRQWRYSLRIRLIHRSS
jgi:hypothetical protein